MTCRRRTGTPTVAVPEASTLVVFALGGAAILRRKDAARA